MSDKTQAERELIDYVLSIDWSKNSAMIHRVAAVRLEQTWPGALSAAECAERYPEVLGRIDRSEWPDMITALNRARADGIEWAAEQLEANDHHSTYVALRSLLPNRGAT